MFSETETLDEKYVSLEASTISVTASLSRPSKQRFRSSRSAQDQPGDALLAHEIDQSVVGRKLEQPPKLIRRILLRVQRLTSDYYCRKRNDLASCTAGVDFVMEHEVLLGPLHTELAPSRHVVQYEDRQLRASLHDVPTAQRFTLRPRPAEPSNIRPRQQSEDDQTERETGAGKVISPDSFAVVRAGDPFSALPVDLPRHVVTEQVNDSWRCLTDMVTNRTFGDAYGPQFATYILSFASENVALLHSMMKAAMMYTRVARNDASNYMLELTVGAKAVELLNKELSRSDIVVTDAILWAVFVLGYTDSVGQLRSGKRPRQSFLRELQSLHIYGRQAINPAHVGGLSKLLQIIGGIEKIKTPGMAQAMSYADLFESSRNLRRPYLPFVPHTQTFLFRGYLAMSDDEREWTVPVLGQLGTGFQSNWTTSSEIDSAVCIVIQNLCDFTIIVDNYVEGRQSYRLPAELTDQRNYVQHSLMSLPSAAEIRAHNQGHTDIQYECCRLACIAYSVLVVFPLPPVVGLFEKVASRLRRELMSLDEALEGFGTERLKLQLWILMLGTIISIGLPQYSSYQRNLSLLVARLSPKNWQEVLSVLQTFLWHPATNDRDGIEIWRDLRRQSQP